MGEAKPMLRTPELIKLFRLSAAGLVPRKEDSYDGRRPRRSSVILNSYTKCCISRLQCGLVKLEPPEVFGQDKGASAKTRVRTRSLLTARSENDDTTLSYKSIRPKPARSTGPNIIFLIPPLLSLSLLVPLTPPHQISVRPTLDHGMSKSMIARP